MKVRQARAGENGRSHAAKSFKFSVATCTFEADISLLSKVVLYEARETIWAFCDREERHLEPMEGGTVAA